MLAGEQEGGAHFAQKESGAGCNVDLQRELVAAKGTGSTGDQVHLRSAWHAGNTSLVAAPVRRSSRGGSLRSVWMRVPVVPSARGVCVAASRPGIVFHHCQVCANQRGEIGLVADE